MTGDVLSAAQIESFAELGYCALRAPLQRMEEKAGIREADPSTWPQAYDIEEHLNNPEVLACFSDRLAAAVEQLLGPNRWCGIRKWGLWPVSFSYGADQPGDFPTTSWHIDGNWFRHSVDCPYQGLLLIGLFTDTGPQGGGTIPGASASPQSSRSLDR